MKVSKRFWKWLLVIWIIYPVLIVVSIISIFYISVDKYENIVGAEDYRSLYDWDYPAGVRGDFNNDGIEDDVTSGGCITFGPLPGNFSPPPPLMCNPHYSSDRAVAEVGKGVYPYHSYMIKEDRNWFVLVLERDFSFKKFKIEEDKRIIEVQPNDKDNFNELVYITPVLVGESLLHPSLYLGPVAGVLYAVILIALIFKIEEKKRHKNFHGKNKEE